MVKPTAETPELPDTEALFRNTSDAVILVDGDRRVLSVNPRAETLLQREARSLVGNLFRESLADFSGSAAEEQLETAWKSTFERRVEHFSPSRYTWYEIRSIPYRQGRMLLVRDISDRARQVRSDAVREALRQIIMDAPVAISITRGPEHRYEIMNNEARKLVGDRNVEGKTARAAFPEVDQSLFTMLDDVYRSGKSVTLRDLAVSFDRDGERVSGTFDVTYQPLLETDGTISGVISVSVETTAYADERRRLEAREKTSERR